MRPLLPLLPLALLAACQPSGEEDATKDTAAPKPGAFAAITEQETLHFTGTEPFWNGTVTGKTLVWSTTEEPESQTIPVQRFTGNNALAYTGELGPRMFDMAVAQAACNDGMSDRTYPFTVTVQISDEVRQGCGWTDAKPFEGAEKP